MILLLVKTSLIGTILNQAIVNLKKKRKVQIKNPGKLKKGEEQRGKSKKWVTSSCKVREEEVANMEYILQHTVLDTHCQEEDYYGDRYDEHGVKIEKRDDETEILQNYFI